MAVISDNTILDNYSRLNSSHMHETNANLVLQYEIDWYNLREAIWVDKKHPMLLR